MNEKGLTDNGTGSAKRKRLEDAGIEVVDLSDDDDAPPTLPHVKGSAKRQRTSEKVTTPSSDAVPDTAVTHSLPTPEPTPQKKALYEIPEIADRYVPKTSTAEGIEYKNPQILSFKPACFRKWRDKEFVKLIEELRAQFDPIPLALAIGRPVEEVKHVIQGVVVNPLYDCMEAQRRVRKGIQEDFDLFAKGGTPSRLWGKELKDGEKVKRAKGELCGVAVGSVQLILADGSKKALMVEELSDADEKYLDDTLTRKDKRMLWRHPAATKQE